MGAMGTYPHYARYLSICKVKLSPLLIVDTWSKADYIAALTGSIRAGNSKILSYLMSIRKDILIDIDVALYVDDDISVETFSLISDYIGIGQFLNSTTVSDDKYVCINKFKLLLSTELCSICYTTVTQLTTQCMHCFCVTCFRTWMKISTYCRTEQ
jgi:hypothetical protein